MKLYSYWRSSTSYRARIALNLKGLEYDYVPVSMLKDGGEHKKPDYLALNPQGLVPYLIDGDVRIGQSPAILEYLEERYPDPALLPREVSLRARVREMMNIPCCDIHPIDNLRVLKYLQGEFGVSDAQKNAWYVHWIELGFAAIEKLLERAGFSGPYCFGDQVTFADICLVPQAYNARRFGVELDPWPRLAAVVAACNALPAFEKAAPENQPDAV